MTPAILIIDAVLPFNRADESVAAFGTQRTAFIAGPKAFHARCIFSHSDEVPFYY